MSLHALRIGHRVKIGTAVFVITQRLPEGVWQLQNAATGEWQTFAENDLLDQFAANQLSFLMAVDDAGASAATVPEKLTRDLSAYPAELVDLARNRVQYLKEIDRQQPIAITRTKIEDLVRLTADRIGDSNPPSWRTVCRDYRKWLTAGRDIRAIIPRHAERGKAGTRLVPEVKAVSDQVIQELYMTAERKRVPEVHLEIARRLSDANKYRPETDRLPIPSRSTIYREIQRRPPYETMVARYGKRVPTWNLGYPLPAPRRPARFSE